MTSPLFVPKSVSSNGTTDVYFVEDLTNFPLAPKLADITDASSIRLGCYLTGDGGWNPSVSENNAEDSRVCTEQIFESRGDYTHSLEIMYTFNPPSASDNEAQLGLPEGTTGFLVARYAYPSKLNWAVGQKVHVYPVEMGVQQYPQAPRNSQHKIAQKAFVTGPVLQNVAIIA